MEKNTLGEFIGESFEEDFSSFDLREIQEVLSSLKDDQAIDLAHAERLQQKALRGADILIEYLGKIVKTVSYLETKINSTKNSVALNYQSPEGRTTMEMRKFAAESSKEVEELQISLSKAKAAKIVIEKKLELLIKGHHHWKDISMGLRKTIVGYAIQSQDKVPEWETTF